MNCLIDYKGVPLVVSCDGRGFLRVLCLTCVNQPLKLGYTLGVTMIVGMY